MTTALDRCVDWCTIWGFEARKELEELRRKENALAILTRMTAASDAPQRYKDAVKMANRPTALDVVLSYAELIGSGQSLIEKPKLKTAVELASAELSRLRADSAELAAMKAKLDDCISERKGYMTYEAICDTIETLIRPLPTEGSEDA